MCHWHWPFGSAYPGERLRLNYSVLDLVDQDFKFRVTKVAKRSVDDGDLQGLRIREIHNQFFTKDVVFPAHDIINVDRNLGMVSKENLENDDNIVVMDHHDSNTNRHNTVYLSTEFASSIDLDGALKILSNKMIGDNVETVVLTHHILPTRRRHSRKPKTRTRSLHKSRYTRNSHQHWKEHWRKAEMEDYENKPFDQHIDDEYFVKRYIADKYSEDSAGESSDESFDNSDELLDHIENGQSSTE